MHQLYWYAENKNVLNKKRFKLSIVTSESRRLSDHSTVGPAIAKVYHQNLTVSSLAHMCHLSTITYNMVVLKPFSPT